MSRIGRKPIEIPQGVEVMVNGTTVTVKGPKGTLTRTFHPRMRIEKEGNILKVARLGDTKLDKSLHGLTRSLLYNMIEGVTKGFEKALEVNGLGYRVQKRGETLVLNVGFTHPVEINPPEGISFEVEGQVIRVKGIDKEKVGQVAADIR
ncbi:MAG: 50S ribosomal protein L6, partial [Candidatus Caldatribacterium sp.]|nr:50S ribosomal protein L6 [Candidatus Caldatribacterium sp.]